MPSERGGMPSIPVPGFERPEYGTERFVLCLTPGEGKVRDQLLRVISDLFDDQPDLFHRFRPVHFDWATFPRKEVEPC